MVSCDTVVFWGAGLYAFRNFEELNQQFKPVAFGDNNTGKHGTRLMGLPVLSLEEITRSYPRCLFYITTDPLLTKYDIIGLLTERGIANERIINYEEVKKYKSCIHLETHLSYVSNGVGFCCPCPCLSRNPSPVIPHGATYAETIQAFFMMRDRIIDEINTSPESMREENPCAGCPDIVERWWGTSRGIKEVHLEDFRSVCNFKCKYCDIHYDQISDFFDDDIEKMIDFLTFMKENRYINHNTTVVFGSGEISVHPLRDRILSAMQEYPCLFFSNASVYSTKIGKILQNKKNKMVTSLDAGTSETFAKIKGVNLFDDVCKNLEQYAHDGNVVLKYIFLSGVNDNERDVRGFIDICKRIEVQEVRISSDIYDLNELDEHTIYMMKLLECELQAPGMLVTHWPQRF